MVNLHIPEQIRFNKVLHNRDQDLHPLHVGMWNQVISSGNYSSSRFLRSLCCIFLKAVGAKPVTCLNWLERWATLL